MYASCHVNHFFTLDLQLHICYKCGFYWQTSVILPWFEKWLLRCLILIYCPCMLIGTKECAVFFVCSYCSDLVSIKSWWVMIIPLFSSLLVFWIKTINFLHLQLLHPIRSKIIRNYGNQMWLTPSTLASFWLRRLRS